MTALVEVHDAAELERALAAGADVVGINNRDLSTFRSSVAVTLELVRRIPPDVVVISESGLATREDLATVGAAGADAVLMGEALLRNPRPGDAVAALTGVPRGPRTATAGPEPSPATAVQPEAAAGRAATPPAARPEPPATATAPEPPTPHRTRPRA